MELPPWELEEQKKWERQFGGMAQERRDSEEQEQDDSDLPPLLLATTDNITARRITYLGLVQGSVVLSRSLMNHILAKTAESENFGGDIDTYTGLLHDSRKIAAERMMKEARSLNANGVVGVRYQTVEIMQNVIEIIAYGTAVTYI